MRKRDFLVGALLLAIVLPSAAWAKDYAIDASHTTVRFRVRHLFTTVEGRFGKFEGNVQFDSADLKSAKVTGTIDVATIDTNHEKRDEHLRAKDFFFVEEYPQIKFESTSVSDVDVAAKTGKLHGKLTMRGVTKDVVLDVAFTGEGTDPWGNSKAGFTASTKINRKDFGLNWNEALETGGVLVGEEVEIRIDAEANVQ
jgi:polyisoprenoid-binding protein YceI